MLVILDSNVLISALLTSSGPPLLIYLAWLQKRFELVTCREQIEEIRNASRYPRLRASVSPQQFGTVINHLKKSQIKDSNLPRLYSANDPNDSFLLNLAALTGAHYLVTGDKKSQILARGKVESTTILSARDFCTNVLKLAL